MKQLTLRLPDDLHAALKTLAERERRSMHAELLHIISERIEEEGMRDGPSCPTT